jgi:hypothetical protein
MLVEQAVIALFIAVWACLSVVVAMVGRRGVLSWTAAVAWSVPACVLALLGTWVLPRSLQTEGADPLAPSDMWTTYFALTVWATPFLVVAVWKRTRTEILAGCVVVAVAIVAGLAITLFQIANPDELILLTTQSNRPEVGVVVGSTLTLVGLVLVASVDRQSGTRHARRLVAATVAFGGAAVSISMTGLLWVAWLGVAAATTTLVIAAIRADRQRGAQMS